MIKLNDFRVGWRQLLADPVYSVIVILELSVAIAGAYLIMGFLVDAMLPETKIAHPEQMVALDFKPNIPDRKLDWTGAAPFVLRDALLAVKAPISASGRALKTDLSMKTGDQVVKVDTVFADIELAAMFGLQSDSGDLTDALTHPDSVALTIDAAERIFGKQDVLGKQVSVNGKVVTVRAILPRQNGNSQLQFEALAPFNSVINELPKEDREGWYSLSGRVYATLAPQATAEDLGGIAQTIFDQSPVIKEVPPGWIANGRKAAFLRAMPMDRIALDGAGSGERRLMYGGLATAALTMLLLAAVNYVNLTTVRTLNRQREIAVHKSLGAGPGRLTMQLIIESIVVALLAAAAGVLLAFFLAPAFSELLDHRFDNRLFSPGKLVALLIGCIVLGVITGLYPARVAFGINCAESLSGRNHSENASGRWVRRAMTALQFAAAITLSAVAMAILWQSYFVSHMNNGFRSEGLLAVSLPATATVQSASAMHDALAREPGVQGVGWSDAVPGSNPTGDHDTFTSKNNPQAVLIRINSVDSAFFGVYEIPLLAGDMNAIGRRSNESTAATTTSATPDLSATEAPQASSVAATADKPVVLDRTAAQMLGFANPQDAIGASVKGSNDQYFRVAAVIERVRQESAHSEAAPQIFFLNDGQFGASAVLTLRVTKLPEARKAVTTVWQREFPDSVVVMDTVDNYLAQHYKDDRTIGTLIAASSMIALLLASLGVYALAAYTVRIKTREIVIRKLHGAGSSAIAGLLIKEFSALLGIGLIIGLPLAWLACAQYMAAYIERAPIGIWPMLAAVLATALMAALAAMRHTLAAMAIRPVRALQG